MKLENAVNRKVLEAYDTLTTVEKSIADFFVKNQEKRDFSSKTIANELFVSEASLSRFAKKCGYKGFREFIYEYVRFLRKDENPISHSSGLVLDAYRELLEKTKALISDEQITRVEKMLTQCKRIKVYGKGSSGYAAQEFSLRLMRMGMDIEAITDNHIIKMSAALADTETLVMAISLSGTTPELVTAVKYARKNGAKVIMITSNTDPELMTRCDEVIHIAGMKSLDEGTMISPQFPVLIMIDILFTCFFQTDSGQRLRSFHETLMALHDEENGEKSST
jgi:DNA-binding MurR/RpiR family transcriptional regulator